MSQSRKPPEQALGRHRIPGATYRFQLNSEFTFSQAADTLGYLRDLGITDCYASPLFKAGPQSTHGYDVCGFDQFNPALGGREGFDLLAARLQQLGLGLILDMVPNHMGNDLTNPWWMDVLEHGRVSPFALFFDIDWDRTGSDHKPRVLVPVLEDHYFRVLEAGKLGLLFREGTFAIKYYDKEFPVAPHSYGRLMEEMAGAVPDGAAQLAGDLQDMAAELKHRYATAEPSVADSIRFKTRLAQLARTAPRFAEAVYLVCQRFNGQVGKPRSFDRLHALLSEQHYRLSFWKAGPEEINYRRFFDVTSLVSVRMELPMVFQASHQLVFELIKQGQVTGLRIDHPDGLWDPKEYFRRLQANVLRFEDAAELAADPQAAEQAAAGWLAEHLVPVEQELMREPGQAHAPGRLAPPSRETEPFSPGKPVWPFYVVAEKILSQSEPLRRDWPIDGTTGYDFLNQVNGLFVNRANATAFERLYQELSGSTRGFSEAVYSAKLRIVTTALLSDLNALAHRLRRLATQTRYGQDFTFSQFHRALAAIIATFPVYRTFIEQENTRVIPREQIYIQQAVSRAQRLNPHLDTAVFGFIEGLLLLRSPQDCGPELKQAARDFVMQFQQLTGPVMAKGLEDTTFYRYNRLISLNEVGGDPGEFGITLEHFHEANLARCRDWPHSLLATATHDTKRGEDVRARIDVLSELPEEWQAAVVRWRGLNEHSKSVVSGQAAPDANDEYFLYQTLIGAWPEAVPLSGAQHVDEQQHQPDFDLKHFRQRIVAYMTKVGREAKTHTSWTEPNAAYETATTRFVEGVLEPSTAGAFLEEFIRLQRKISFFGEVNSLAQVLLKTTAPGVPDFYQGTDLWDFNLVDPDNRRPVDYNVRRRLLAELEDKLKDSERGGLVQQLLSESSTGQVKLFLIQQSLQFRQSHRELFDQGQYVPLATSGDRGEHVCSFARVYQQNTLIVAVPRLVYGLSGGSERLPLGEAVWGPTCVEIPQAVRGRRFTNALTGEAVSAHEENGRIVLRIADILHVFPVALLTT